MNTAVKTTIAAVAASSMLLGTLAVPATASARQPEVCRVEKSKDAKTGMILGAVAGGLLGSQISKNEKGLGAITGALAGGVIGNKLGKDHGKGTCKKIEAYADEAYGYRHNSRYSHNSRYARPYAYNDSYYGRRY